MKSSLKSIKRFQRKFGERAKSIIRFEWANYKRVLRVPGEDKWKPVRMTLDQFYKRFYREDEQSELNWSTIAVPPGPERPVIPERASSSAEQLHNEYMNALVQPGNHYSVQQEVPASSDDAEATPKQEEVHFKLINVVTAQTRPHTMHTVTSADEVEQFAPVAWEIVREARVPTVPTENAPLGHALLSYNLLSEWTRPWSIADFEAFNKTLRVWQRSEPSTTLVACTQLSEPERARIRFPVLDDRCPVLAIVQHLKNHGWSAIQGAITHTTNEVGAFDATEALRQKRYLQTVCKIDHCMPLTSAIPSRQVIHFYDCLLRGIAVEPNLPNAHYAMVLNSQRLREGRTPKVLPIADGNVLPDDDDDGIIGAIRHVAEPKPKMAPVQSVRASRVQRAKVKPAPTPVCPPPSIDPVPVCGGNEPLGGGDAPPPPVPPVQDDDDGFAAPSSSSRRDRSATGILGKTTCPGLTPGTEITFQDYTVPGGSNYPNFIMTCAQCAPIACKRTHGDLDKFRATCGEIEPLAWLHCWERLPLRPGKKHNLMTPPHSDVVVYAEAHRDDLTRLYRDLRRLE